MFFNIKDVNPESKLITCVIGARGTGKSYSVKEMIVDDYLLNGNQAIIIRRYKNQSDSIKKNYFEDVMKYKYPDLEYKTRGDEGLLEGNPFVFFTALNGNSMAKGSSFPSVKWIIYEEFMPEEGERFIKDEYAKLESLLITVDRNQDRVRLICVGNNTTYYNPIFETLKIFPKPVIKGDNRIKIVQKDLIQVISLPPNEEFVEHVKNTMMGKLTIMSGSFSYNTGNELTTNDLFNVCNKSDLPGYANLKPLFTVRIDKEKVIKVWKNSTDGGGYLWIDNHFKGNTEEYFTDYEYQTKDNKHISLYGKYNMDTIKLYYNLGRVYFKNGEVKFHFELLLKYTR